MQTFSREVYGNNPSHKSYTIIGTQQLITLLQFSINAIKTAHNQIAPPGRNSSPPGDSNQNKNTRSSLMSRLAVGIKPPGGFWEKPRNPIEQRGKQMEIISFRSQKHKTMCMYLKTSKATPLTWIPCKIRVVVLLPSPKPL